MNRLLMLIVITIAFASSALAQSEHKSHHHHTELSPADFSKDSLYQLESLWSLSSGSSVTLSSFRGKPQIVTMFYSTCTSACPVLVNHVQQIERELQKRGVQVPGFIFVTFDPERDSREMLDAYAAKRELRSPNWNFLRASSPDTQELAVILGMKYKDVGDGVFAHSNIITLLDSDGRIAHRHIGLDLKEDDIEKFVTALAPIEKKK